MLNKQVYYIPVILDEKFIWSHVIKWLFIANHVDQVNKIEWKMLSESVTAFYNAPTFI